jgi:predicted nucleotidyltransferase
LRKKSVADALWPAGRQGILKLTLNDPDRWWYLSELAQALEKPPSSLQRELDSLVTVGILDTRRDGRRVYYRPAADSAIFEELRAIVRKTMGVPQEIRAALEPLARRIRLALLFGSVAKKQDRAGSDIDLLIVADDITLEEVFRAVAPAERTLRRKVSPTIYSPAEFRQRRKKQNPFLENVLSGPHVVLLGSEDAVAAR